MTHDYAELPVDDEAGFVLTRLAAPRQIDSDIIVRGFVVARHRERNGDLIDVAGHIVLVELEALTARHDRDRFDTGKRSRAAERAEGLVQGGLLGRRGRFSRRGDVWRRWGRFLGTGNKK